MSQVSLQGLGLEGYSRFDWGFYLKRCMPGNVDVPGWNKVDGNVEHDDINEGDWRKHPVAKAQHHLTYPTKPPSFPHCSERERSALLRNRPTVALGCRSTRRVWTVIKGNEIKTPQERSKAKQVNIFSPHVSEAQSSCIFDASCNL